MGGDGTAGRRNRRAHPAVPRRFPAGCGPMREWWAARRGRATPSRRPGAHAGPGRDRRHPPRRAGRRSRHHARQRRLRRGVVVVDLHVPGYGCATSTAPLLAGVERIMRDRVPGVASVVQECGADATLRHHGRPVPAPPADRLAFDPMSTPQAGRNDPATLLAAARSGDRRARARLLSLVEAGDAAGREVGRLVFPLAGGAYTVGLTGAPGAGKSTLTTRAARPDRAPRTLPVGRARRRPVVAVHRRRDPRRSGPHGRPRPRHGRVHPVDGHAGSPRGAGARHARGGARARRRGRRRGCVIETVGVGPGRGRGGGRGRHHRRGA